MQSIRLLRVYLQILNFLMKQNLFFLFGSCLSLCVVKVPFFYETIKIPSAKRKKSLKRKKQLPTKVSKENQENDMAYGNEWSRNANFGLLKLVGD